MNQNQLLIELSVRQFIFNECRTYLLCFETKFFIGLALVFLKKVKEENKLRLKVARAFEQQEAIL